MRAYKGHLLLRTFCTSQSVDAPRAGTCKHQIQKNKTVEDRCVAAVLDGEETPRRVRDEVRGSHQAREDEGDWPGE